MSLWTCVCVSVSVFTRECEFISTFQWVCLNTCALLTTVSLSPFSLQWKRSELLYVGQRLETTDPPKWHILLPHCPISLLTTLSHETHTHTQCRSTCKVASLDNGGSREQWSWHIHDITVFVCVCVCLCGCEVVLPGQSGWSSRGILSQPPQMTSALCVWPQSNH